jgi:hypothetical protein
MTEWTLPEVEQYAARFGLTWLTPELTALLHAAMEKSSTDGAAVPRQPTEFSEPAHIFAGPSR